MDLNRLLNSTLWLPNFLIRVVSLLQYTGLPVENMVASMSFQVSRKKTLIVVCANATNRCLEYLVFLNKVGQLLKRVLSPDSTVLPGDFSAHSGNDRDTWRLMIGRNSQLDLYQGSEMLF